MIKRTLSIMRNDPLSLEAREIGYVEKSEEGIVILQNKIGTNRILDMLSGEQLPRIC